MKEKDQEYASDPRPYLQESFIYWPGDEAEIDGAAR